MASRPNEYHPAFEEYCEAIFELREDQLDVIQARIADRLEVSRPAVSEMIKRMEANDLVHTERNAITLTKAGMAIAERVVRRHRLAERFLTDILGLSWALAHVEAGKWEHVISEPVEEAMSRVLGEPTTCPHGNPIPGSEYSPVPSIALAELPQGAHFVVSRIPEELEFEPGMLEFLEDHQLVPGREGVVRTAAASGTVMVEIGGVEVDVTRFASERILVAAG